MKIYKSPFVSRESYFVRIGKAFSRKNEASKSKGYAIDFINGKWRVEEACYYDCHLMDMPIVVENKVSIQRVVKKAVLDAVLGLVGGVRNEKD